MLPRADLNPTRPPASLEAATTVVSSTDARLEVIKRLNQISIGRELQATVEAVFEDNTFLVKIADANARMALPVGTKVGDTLSMVFLASQPRPTFLLTQQQGSAPATLSTIARLIDHLMQSVDQNGDPPVVMSKAPLLASPAALDSKQMAATLQNTIASSGLFYESHLHEWISGGKPRAELSQEPQSQLPRSLSPPAAQAAAREAPPVDIARLAANIRELGEDSQKLSALVRGAQLQPASIHATDADLITALQPEALPDIEPEAARLIGLQLNTLEHEAIRWQGQLWPGQPMEWEIHEEKPGGGSREGQQTPEQAWTSTVRFELPHLGDISATIRLVGDRVHVQVDTASEDTASTVRHYGGMLADALEAAGAPLDSLTVKRHESI